MALIIKTILQFFIRPSFVCLPLILAFGHMFSAVAQSTRDYAIELSATIQESPPQIALHWINNFDGVDYAVFRKAKESTNWGTQTLLPNWATDFFDTNVVVGSAYEYRVTKSPLPQYGGSGYIFAGIRAPLTEARGKVILVVDNTYAASLTNELSRLQQDMVGDGWTVIRHDVSRTATTPSVKALIQNEYWIDPANVKSVFLFGHVPVPYSGNYNADDHSDHTGAWAADTYYGDMDGTWTDSTVTRVTAARAANRNIPGDGKFDQSLIPSDIELQVGRVDLSNMPDFLPKTELDLLRQYLNKDHNFRHGLVTTQRRGLIYDGFGISGGEAYAASGWRNFAPFFTSSGTTEIGNDQFFPVVGGSDYLWSCVASGGDPNYELCYSVGTTSDFATTDVKTVFTMVFGSYFGDWDATNDFLRAPLGSTTYCLASVWAGRPHWYLHHMGLGETIGYSTRLTQNNTNSYHPLIKQHRGVHIALMGDPTLRMHVVKPPANLSASFNNGVLLSWNAPAETALQGYNVYRAASAAGPFVRINGANPITTTNFFDPVSGGNYTYLVRAVKLESSPSGSYFNLSQGIFLNVSAPSPVNFSVLSIVSGQFRMRCSGVAGQTFAIQSTTNFVNWTSLVTNTLTGPTFDYTDPTSTGSGRRFYRTKTLP